MPSRAVYTALAFARSVTGCSTVLMPSVVELVMVTPELVVLMSMAVTLATARDGRFSIPDRSGRLSRHARRPSQHDLPSLRTTGDREPFLIHVDDAVLIDLRERIAKTRWPDSTIHDPCSAST